MRMRKGILGLVLFMGSGASGWAQETAPVKTEKATPAAQTDDAARRAVPKEPMVLKTFHLVNVVSPNELNEIVSTLRNLLSPYNRLYPVVSQNAIVIDATSSDLEAAQRLINELDRPKRTYRLTYTMTEREGGKQIGTQHFSMIVVAGQRTVIKQGSKVPVMSGGSAQFTYEDIGVNFDASLDEFTNGVRLRSKVEATSVPEERVSGGSAAPVIRQTSLEGTAFLAPGKPMMLGSLDVPGSPRHIDVEVVMEQVP